MLNCISLVISIVALLIGIATLIIAIFLQKKANKLQIDISGFIIREITKNPNYTYPIIGKDGKLHLVIELGITDGFKLGDKPNLDKKDNN